MKKNSGYDVALKVKQYEVGVVSIAILVFLVLGLVVAGAEVISQPVTVSYHLSGDMNLMSGLVLLRNVDIDVNITAPSYLVIGLLNGGNNG